MEIRPMGAELFHVEGQAGMTELIVDISNFAEKPKILLRVSDHQIRKTGPEKTPAQVFVFYMLFLSRISRECLEESHALSLFSMYNVHYCNFSGRSGDLYIGSTFILALSDMFLPHNLYV
jgi:hypothetical protein